MRSVTVLSVVAFAGTVVALLALTWQAQRDTNRKLDALTEALAARSPGPVAPGPVEIPREREKASHPSYVIELPDILSVEVVVRDPVTKTTNRLPTQAVSGSFLVRPDGTIGLGAWGSVPVSGLTIPQAADAIRRAVTGHELFKAAGAAPEALVVVIDVLAYNSKRCYVVHDADGNGEQVYAFPITGNETVLDAIANVNGLQAVSSKRKIWIARRTPDQGQQPQILPVDWNGITQQGLTTTNYQVMPGDRLYVTSAK